MACRVYLGLVGGAVGEERPAPLAPLPPQPQRHLQHLPELPEQLGQSQLILELPRPERRAGRAQPADVDARDHVCGHAPSRYSTVTSGAQRRRRGRWGRACGVLVVRDLLARGAAQRLLPEGLRGLRDGLLVGERRREGVAPACATARPLA